MADIVWTPPGTVPVAQITYHDQISLRRLSRMETATAWAQDYRRDHAGEWPTIKQIVGNLDCGFGTAQRALRRAKAAGLNENIHVDKIQC